MPRTRKIWRKRPKLLRPLVDRVIKLFPNLVGHVEADRIFLCSFGGLESKAVARIYGARPPWCVADDRYDYALAVWSPTFEGYALSRQLYILLHELVHIPVSGHFRGTPRFRSVDEHDIQDFKVLREAYGLKLENVNDIFQGEKLLEKRRKPPTEGERLHYDPA